MLRLFEGESTPYLKKVIIWYKAIDWHSPSIELEKSVTLSINYSEYGYIDGLELSN